VKEYLICVEGTSYLTVAAESPEAAKEAAKDVFLAHHVEDLNVAILSVSPVEE
jgi:hypothetical protein